MNQYLPQMLFTNKMSPINKAMMKEREKERYLSVSGNRVK